jgi:antitoxin component YwqK of YwqJK toxin-antitoxin module
LVGGDERRGRKSLLRKWNVERNPFYKKNVMDGTWLTFNEKKVRIAEAHYLDGKKDGKWYIWDDDGRLIYELEYINGEKTGNWKKYDTAGNVISERNYSIK